MLRLEDAVPVRVVRRLNRFVVQVSLQGGDHLAWLNNTGRLLEFLVPGREAFCLPRQGQGKTRYRFFAVSEGPLAALIDTHLQMRAFEECLRRGALPWLSRYTMVRRNVPLGASLIDYSLAGPDGELYLEVKSAVLRNGSFAMYPDCPSVRGQKHISELTRYVASGGRAAIVFVGALPGVRGFRPNCEADARVCALLRQARETGVDVQALGLCFDPADLGVHLFAPDLPVHVD